MLLFFKFWMQVCLYFLDGLNLAFLEGADLQNILLEGLLNMSIRWSK